MSEVSLIPLGVGEAFAGRRYTASMVVGVDGEWLLLECPHPIRKMLIEGSEAAGIPLDLDRISALAVSHLHADHCSGLEDYGFYSYFILKRRAQLLMHPTVSAKLWSGLLSAGMGEMLIDRSKPPLTFELSDFFDLQALSETSAVTSGKFAIECRPTIHPVPTTAFRIKAGGRTLAFSADTAFDPDLIDWLAEADLIVHEVTMHAESPVHTPYEKLIALPSSVRDKMRLIHYSDDFDLESSQIEPLHQGRLYRV
ncbi:MBL fold metallo-hydrolase [Singulisphaera sp. PoT]|uniref:MBL fold metallo-hydrolase n=1 Tax=Singulisphaera sp. PoT TaxID=3411797 RepID=UPI003BF4EFBB